MSDASPADEARIEAALDARDHPDVDAADRACDRHEHHLHGDHP